MLQVGPRQRQALREAGASYGSRAADVREEGTFPEERPGIQRRVDRPPVLAHHFHRAPRQKVHRVAVVAVLHHQIAGGVRLRREVQRQGALDGFRAALEDRAPLQDREPHGDADARAERVGQRRRRERVRRRRVGDGGARVALGLLQRVDEGVDAPS